MLAISLTIACSRYRYDGVILPAHPVRGESHTQRNTTGEVATTLQAYNVITSVIWNKPIAIDALTAVVHLRWHQVMLIGQQTQHVQRRQRPATQASKNE